MFLIEASNRRAREWDIVIYESDDTTPVALASDDVVRVKIGTNDDTPPLDLSSMDSTEVLITNGAGGAITLYLTEMQVATLGNGAWDVEVAVFDGSEGKLKHAMDGVLFVHPSQLGDVGGEESSSSGESSASSSRNSSSSSF